MSNVFHIFVIVIGVPFVVAGICYAVKMGRYARKLEDQADALAARIALEEPGPSIPQDKVKRDFQS